MRPIRLTLENLRSYRTRQEISFEDLGLFAITGSTGAGKSSLLEGLVYALYGCTTWDRRSVKALISDGPGDPTMTVSLLFEVKGQRWRVDRSSSRGNKASVHCLRREDGDGAFDGEAEVNKHLQELLGLDVDQFLKTVVLPQGKFAQLLDAKASERSEVLKSLLGLNELDSMLATVTARASEVKEVLIAARALRGKLPADPSSAVEEARKVVEEARRLESLMAGQLEACRARGAEIEAARAERDKLSEQRNRLRDLRQDLGTRLEELDRLESELGEKSAALSGDEAKAQGALESAEQAKQERESTGRTRTRLSTWLGLARSLADLEPQLAKVTGQLGQCTADRDAAMVELERLAVESETLAARCEELTAEGKAARTAHDEAQNRVKAAERWLDGRRAASDSLEKVRATIKAERETSDQELEGIESLEQSHVRAQAEVAERKADQARIQQEQKVAAVAEHCRPEDPCPVCARALPGDWRAPRGEGLEEAAKAVKAAENRQQAAFKAWQAADARNQARAQSLAKLEKEERDGTKALTEMLAQGRELLGAETDFEQSDDRLLEPLRALQTEAQQTVEKLRETYTELNTERQKGEAVRGERQKALDLLGKQIVELTAEGERLEKRRQEARAELGEQTAATLEAELEQAVQADERVAGCLSETNRLSKLRAELQQRSQRELEQPRREVEKALNEQRVQLAALGVELTLPESLVAAARTIEEQRLAALERWDSNLEEGAGRMAALEEQLRSQLAELGADSLKDLETRARQDADVRARAEQALEGAERDRETARQLDDALLPVERLQRNLEFLQGTLGNKKNKNRQPFSQWLLELRQGELLELASTRLLEMTGQQYGFSPQFTIVDRHSGQSRKPETLSGGETFMASLALALALSELVGRKGGKLEAFFLDEGFGSLSPDCLDRALDALENLVGTGRLIGVISHVSAVAERLERVLRVTKSPHGSTVEELTQSAARELAREELAGRLRETVDV